MGRGRAKAKQTKVARRLKYQELDTDFDALQQELHGSGDNGEPPEEGSSDEYDNGDASDLRWR